MYENKLKDSGFADKKEAKVAYNKLLINQQSRNVTMKSVLTEIGMKWSDLRALRDYSHITNSMLDRVQKVLEDDKFWDKPNIQHESTGTVTSNKDFLQKDHTWVTDEKTRKSLDDYFGQYKNRII